MSVLESCNSPPVNHRCDLCDGDRFEIVAQRDRHGKPLRTVVCTACGLVAHERIPSDAEMDQYYATQYRRDYHGEWTPSARRVVRAWRNGQRLFRQLTSTMQPGDRVFEVGAGIGCNVKAFELGGFEASGIEPGIGFCEFAQTKLHAQVANRTLFDVPPEPAYDLVLLIHVIEHFNSPRRALEHVHRLLRPGGRLYVECPNLGAPFARRARLFHVAHIHNFTPATLAAMAVRCGFHVERRCSDARDPNLQMLLTRVDVARWAIDPRGLAETRNALGRYNNLTYHLRWNYLGPRLRKLAGYLGERLTAKRQAEHVLRQCGGNGKSTEPDESTELNAKSDVAQSSDVRVQVASKRRSAA